MATLITDLSRTTLTKSKALRLGPRPVKFRLSQLIERHEIAGRDRLLDFSEKMPLQGRVYLPIESVRRRRRNSDHEQYPDALRTLVFRKEPDTGAADIASNPCEGALTTGLVDHAVVNQTDQTAQTFAIAVIVRRGGQFRDRL
jgi:hypothetical protein